MIAPSDTELKLSYIEIINSLVSGRSWCNFKLVIFKLMSRVDTFCILSTSCEIALRWMPQDFADDKSTLVQVMAWCRQATSHYLDQCWPRSISPYGVARPRWVKRMLCFLCPPACNSYRWSLIQRWSSGRVLTLPGNFPRRDHHWASYKQINKSI